MLQWEDLSRSEAVRHIFFRKDGKRRILIMTRHDGYLTYRYERLSIADEEEQEFLHAYGIWEPEDVGGIYDSEEQILRDLKEELADYEEKNFPKNS